MAENNTLELAQQTYLKICRALDNKGWRYQKDDAQLAVSFGVRGEDLEMNFRVKVYEEKQFVFISSVLPYTVPESKRVEVALAVSAVNCKLLAGNFDFNLQKGQIMFRINQSYMGSDISVDAFEKMIMACCGVIDDYNEKFMGIGTGMLDLHKFLADHHNA